MKSFFLKVLISGICALGIASANAEIIITTSDNQIQAGVDNQGWVNNTGPNANRTNDNYITRSAGRIEYRSFFSFDVSNLNQPIESAIFDVRRYGQSGDLTIEIFDVSTSLADLVSYRQQGIPANPSWFTDLGTGVSYGEFFVSNGGSADTLSFNLNSLAVNDINAFSGTYFTIGVVVKTPYSTIFSSSSQEPGNSSNNHTQQLRLTPVPEPSFYAILLGLGTFAFSSWRKRKSQTA